MTAKIFLNCPLNYAETDVYFMVEHKPQPRKESPKMYEKIERKFTQRATPAEEGKRNRRITLTFTPALADRLGILARMDGVSINHAAEMLVEAEYTRRLKDKDAAALIRAIEKQGAK